MESTRHEGRSEPDGNTGLVVQASDMGLIHLAGLADNGALDLSPKFQRRNRWDTTRKSRLIESFLMNAPVPELYLAEERGGTYSVIDGKQRLTAITQFLNDEFRLTNLEFLADHNGRTFSNLPSREQLTLHMRPLRVVTILNSTAEWMKYEVFMRLNTGGQPLNRQEVRNVAFPGPLNDALIDLSSHPFLRQQLKIKNVNSSAYMDMSDVEYVLRFLVLNATWENFSGDLSRTMDTFMVQNQHAPMWQVHEYVNTFTRALDECELLWGMHAFQRWDSQAGRFRDQMIGGMFDAQMIAVASLGRKSYPSNSRARIEKMTMSLFDDPEFDSAVRLQTNTPSKLLLRVSRVQHLLLGL